MKCPDWAKVWRVDEVLECLSFGPKRQAVTDALLRAMPAAYQDKRPPDRPDWTPGCGEARNELPPDPDQANIDGQSLNHVWDQLTPDIQQAIHDAYEKENGGDDDLALEEGGEADDD